MKKFDLSSFALHILAMALMLCDHLWATIVPGQQWMNLLGRLAFPIFAFMIAEGYVHTRNFKKYVLRMLVFALIAEIPFNLMTFASWIFPFQQNVMWTFLLSLLCLRSIDALREKCRPWLALPLAAVVMCAFALVAKLAMVDYGGYGLLTVVLFYCCRGEKWYHKLLQLAGMVILHCFLIRGQNLPVYGGFEFPVQGFAVFALLPIWLYRGRQGLHNRATKYLNYAFYPVHMLILGLLSL